MNEELNRALEFISDEHISETAAYQKKPFPWVKAVAAVLAVVIGWGAIWYAFDRPPAVISPTVSTSDGPVIQSPTIQTEATTPIGPIVVPLANLVASPEYPKMMVCPVYANYEDKDEYYDALREWYKDKDALYDQPTGYADNLSDFWAKSIPEFLSGEGNRAYSPLNVYLALAMLAEVSGGESRQQVLDLLGADSMEALRTQAGHVWNAHYSNDGKTTSLLANSLWLDEMYNFKNDTIQALADNYYASVFHGNLGTEELNEQLRAWINFQTGGLLREQTENAALSEDSVFALVSTLYFAADWSEYFDADLTEDAVFHCKDQDLTTVFMNRAIKSGTYYWGKDFGAVRLELNSGAELNSGSVWLILPDEDKTMEDVLNSGEYLKMTQSPTCWENKQNLNINLSVPKFDISAQADLIRGMKNLGLSDVFDDSTADFSPMTDTKNLFLGKIDHTVRVAVDEAGVIAAAYTVMDFLLNSGFPTNEEIDFVLDRPFLFVVSSHDQLPLITGVVEQP